MHSQLALFVLIASFTAALSAGNDQNCKSDFQTFLQCVKDQRDKQPESQREAAKKQHQAEADRCFQQASCDTIDWNSEKNTNGNKHSQFQMPDAVKQCIKKKMMAKMGQKLNECLTRHGVSNINIADLADHDEAGASAHAHAHAQVSGGKDGMQAGMSARMNVVKAVDQCCQKKGGDPNSVKPLEQCLYNIKRSEKPKMCAMAKPCEQKLSPPCEKRGQDIRKALCLCKKEKEQEIATKLRQLGQQNQKVSTSDLMKAVVDNQDMGDMMKNVDACYKETNTQEPLLMQAMMKMMSGGGGGRGGMIGGRANAATSLNASTCIIMSDMAQLDADDKQECEPCP